MKKATGILVMVVLIATLAACGRVSQGYDRQQTERNGQTENVESTGQMTYTTEVPETYRQEAEEQGQVIRVEYETRDYARSSDAAITKPAYVYLPYGYDENDTQTKYDILYMMHGWTMTAEDYFDKNSSDMVYILDNLIEHGDMPPVIVVSATFDTENQPQSFGRSTEEIAVFHQELRNDLIPFIESRFNTYAEGSSAEGFRNSREHRAFTGFSLGGVTTWYQFIYNLDYIKGFIPMSGDCWILGTYGGRYQPEETTEYLENVVKDGGWNEEDFYIYAGIGTEDPIWDQVNNQLEVMLESDVFTEKNLHYAIKKGGRHDMEAATEYLYHALPEFLNGE